MDCKYTTPSVTIFKADGTVDLEAMERHFDFLIQGGVDGILILGSIGEFFSMPMEEKKKLIRCAVKHIAGRVKLIVGTTSMVTEEIIELSKFAPQRRRRCLYHPAAILFSIKCGKHRELL